MKSPDEARDNNLLARALLAQRKLVQAQTASARATSILGKNKDLHPRLEAAITAAEIRAALGSPRDAERDIETVLENARRVGFFDLQLDAGLALGKLQLRDRSGDVGRAGLDGLQADASAKGFYLIARKAADAKTGH